MTSTVLRNLSIISELERNMEQQVNIGQRFGHHRGLCIGVQGGRQCANAVDVMLGP